MDNNQKWNVTDNNEDQEKFLVHNRDEIIQKLSLLQKDKCTVTAYFNDGSSTLNTNVSDIDCDIDIVLLDYSADEKANEELLKADHIIFEAQLEGIKTQFSTTSVLKVNLQNRSVFAISLPEKLLWIQRRELFRVLVPFGIPVFCAVPYKYNFSREYNVLDISSSGFALFDDSGYHQFESGTILEKCKLDLLDYGNCDIAFEIRNQIPLENEEKDSAKRIGCSFVNLDLVFEATIQRYLNTVQTMYKSL